MSMSQVATVRRVIAEMRRCRWHGHLATLQYWADALEATLGDFLEPVADSGSNFADTTLLPAIPGHSHVVRDDGVLLCGCVWPTKAEP